MATRDKGSLRQLLEPWMWPDHRNALDGAWPSQAAHLTSQVGKRDKDPHPLSFPKWRGYICLLGPVEWFRGAERKLEVPKASPHYRHPPKLHLLE